MKTIINTLITRENVTFLLACIGSIGTILNAIKSFLNNRKKLNVEIIDYANKDSDAKFFLYIQNQSSAPICISAIYLTAGTKKVRCELLRKRAQSFNGILYRTPLFPLNIPPQVGVVHFLVFSACPDVLLASGNIVSFEFLTNRGPINKSLTLQDPSYYLCNRS